MEFNHLKYVEKYLRLNYSTYYHNLSKKEFNAIVMGISTSVRNKYNNIKFVVNGGADKFISILINKYVNDKHQKLRVNYVNLRNYVNKYVSINYGINCGNKTLNLIVEEICSYLMATYNYKKMMNGDIDEKISICYEQVYNGLCDEIRRYVKSYVSADIVPLTDIDNVVVAEEVVKLVMTTNTINSVDLLLGRCKNKINDIAYKNRKVNAAKRLAEMPNTYKYIRDKISKNINDVELLNRIVNSIDIQLRSRGLGAKDIVSGNYDMDIRFLCNEYYFNRIGFTMLNNSVENDEKPNEIKKVDKKREINEIMAKLLIAATLVGAIGYGAHTIERGNKVRNAEKNVEEFDTHSYSSISNIYVDTFELTAENLINTFDDYSKYGNVNFSYLGFYRAYRSVTANEVFIMDNMLSEIKYELNKNNTNGELRDSLRYSSCYLGFMYNRLEEMGYTEIREDKYVDLLVAYIKAKKENPYKDPVESLTSSQERLLNQVKKKYVEYSEQCLLEFGVFLGNQENTESETLGGHSR